MFVAPCIVIAIDAVRRPNALWGTRERRSYIIFPAMILMFIGGAALLIQEYSKSNNFSIITPFMIILTVRYVAISVLLGLVNWSDSLENKISALFDDYQVNKNEAIASVVLGLLGAVIVSMTKDWFIWLIIVGSTGRILIQTYRTNKTGKHQME